LADIPATAANSPNLFLSGTKLSNAPITLGPDPLYGNMQYSITDCRDAPGTWNIINNTGGTPAVNPLTDTDITEVLPYFNL